MSSTEEVVNRLKQPISSQEDLLSLLAAPLDYLGLLPPIHRSHIAESLPRNGIILSRHIPPIQTAILTSIYPTWGPALTEIHAEDLLEQYFCPSLFFNASQTSGEIALLAYTTLLSNPLSSFSIHLLSQLAREYPVDRLHSAVFSLESKATLDAPHRALVWEDCVRNITALPTKVANYAQGSADLVPRQLNDGPFFDHVSKRCEALVHTLSSAECSEEAVRSITYLLTKLANTGAIPLVPPTSPTQPSFFRAVLPIIRHRFNHENADIRTRYRKTWNRLFRSMPSVASLSTIFGSLFSSLSEITPPLGTDRKTRGLVHREARLLFNLVGELDPGNEEIWEAISASVVSQSRDEGFARILVCWATMGGSGKDNLPGLRVLLEKTLAVWSSTEHIKHSLISKHHYFTSLLLLTLSSFPTTTTSTTSSSSQNQILSFATDPALISSVGIYIGHQDASVRRCGMLVGEVVASRAGKKLQFDGWDGDGGWKEWCRDLRRLIGERDVDFPAVPEEEGSEGLEEESYALPSASSSKVPATQAHKTKATPSSSKKGPKVHKPDSGTKKPLISIISSDSDSDSDDSLTGYSSPSSSRAASPTPSELSEIEKDPTLAVQPKRPAKPVYLVQLGEMLMGSTGLGTGTDGNEDALRVEVALGAGEELIRRKRGFGTELEENAVNLVYRFAGLQDNYELDGFEEKRQAALIALVACCPHKAAQCAIQEIYKNQYSTAQRFALLNALGLGARELARLSLPPSHTRTVDDPGFPSRQLPPALHNKYAQAQNPLRRIADGIKREVIDDVTERNEGSVPELVRERRLRVKQSPKVQEIPRSSYPTSSLFRAPADTNPSTPSAPHFSQIAAEHFIMPLINRYWLFLRDSQTREERTALASGRNRYAGAGTGLLLSPLVLSHLLTTLAVLVHAGRSAPEWLAVISPAALEVAIAVGTRAASLRDSDDEEDEGLEGKGKSEAGSSVPEASVLDAALEIALVVLDGSIALDQGRSLALENTPLLLGLYEWANALFAMMERGVRVKGEGGVREVKLRGTVAGVLLKIEEVRKRWGRSMVDVR